MGKSLYVPLAAIFLMSPVYAQRFTSPPETASATINGKKVTVEYYAPSMHGRKIMGGIVPYGEVWCTGANYATAVTSEADLTFGSVKVPKGTFSIWTLPTAQGWTLILNNQTGQSHLVYNQSRDIGRTRMTVKTLLRPVETFRIEVRPGAGNTGTLALIWEQTEADILFTVGK